MNRIGSVTLPNGPADATGEGWPYWSDRHQWSAVEQSARRTLGGAQHLREAGLSGGRLITLQLEDTGRLSQATADALYTLANTPGTHTLELDDGFTTTVAFRRDTNPIDLRPLWPFAAVYVGTIHLIEASP